MGCKNTKEKTQSEPIEKEHKLSKYDWNTPNFILSGKHQARVVDIYDGDTMTVVLEVFKDVVYKFPVRIQGIDTPEMNAKNEELKKISIKAKNRSYELVSGKKFDQDTGKPKKDRITMRNLLCSNLYLVELDMGEDSENKVKEKYGRLLSNVYIKGENLSDILIREKLAVPYSGDTKLTEDDMLKMLK